MGNKSSSKKPVGVRRYRDDEEDSVPDLVAKFHIEKVLHFSLRRKKLRLEDIMEFDETIPEDAMTVEEFGVEGRWLRFSEKVVLNLKDW